MSADLRRGPAGDVARLIESGHRVLYLVSHEESRVLDHLAEMADAFFAAPRELAVWSVTKGWHGAPEACGLAAALGSIESAAEPQAIYVLKDVHPYLDDPLVIRRLRDAIESLRDSDRTIIVLAPSLHMPDEISKDVHVMDYPLPGSDEIEMAVQTALASVSEALGEIVSLPSADREAVVRTLSGLTVDEVGRIVRKVGLAEKRIDIAAAGALLEEKRQVIRKSEVLDYIHNDLRLEHLGGLERFKKWAKVRRSGLSEAARAFGLPKPKGMLFTGISGCGKSLAVQALANEWNLPLLRLDMGRVFAGVAGTPEEAHFIVGVLRDDPKRQLVRVFPERDDPWVLGRQGVGKILIGENTFRYDICLGEALFHIPKDNLGQSIGAQYRCAGRDDIARKFFIQLGRIGFKGFFHVKYSWQNIVFHVDKIQGLQGNIF